MCKNQKKNGQGNPGPAFFNEVGVEGVLLVCEERERERRYDGCRGEEREDSAAGEDEDVEEEEEDFDGFGEVGGGLRTCWHF